MSKNLAERIVDALFDLADDDGGLLKSRAIERVNNVISAHECDWHRQTADALVFGAGITTSAAALPGYVKCYSVEEVADDFLAVCQTRAKDPLAHDIYRTITMDARTLSRMFPRSANCGND